MTATIIVTGVFADGYAPHFADYSRRVRAFLDSHHGVVVRRQRVSAVLEGEGADLVMLIDFPSREIAATIFDRPEYRAIIPLREKIFAQFNMMLADAGEI